MTIAFLSASDEGSISSILKGFHQMEGVYSPGTHNFHYAHIGRIFQPHGARKVGSRISAVMAAESYDPGIEGFIHDCLPP